MGADHSSRSALILHTMLLFSLSSPTSQQGGGFQAKKRGTVVMDENSISSDDVNSRRADCCLGDPKVTQLVEYDLRGV